MKSPADRGKTKPKKKQALPRGWTQKRIQEVITYYENQSEDEQLAEHEAAYAAADQTMMGVPTRLVPEVRRLIARRRGA
jgi:hypothetical protein